MTLEIPIILEVWKSETKCKFEMFYSQCMIKKASTENAGPANDGPNSMAGKMAGPGE